MAARWLRAASFPVKKSLSEYDPSASSVPWPTLEYRPSPEWLRAREWQCLAGPPGPGKNHVVMALGNAAPMLVTRRASSPQPSSSSRSTGGWQTPRSTKWSSRHCGPTPSSSIKSALRRSTTPGRSCCPALSRPQIQHRAVATAGHWAFEDWGRFLPNETTAVSLLDRLLHHSIVVVTDGASFRMREPHKKGGSRSNGLSDLLFLGWGVFLADSGAFNLAIERCRWPEVAAGAVGA
jgi:IstB-like ATP binding protein